MVTMRNLAAVLFVLATLASPALAKDDHVQYDLNKLAKKSGERLKEIDKMVEKAKRKEEAAKKLAEFDSLSRQAESFYNEGKFEEAKPLYRKIISYAKDPDIKAVALEKQKELDIIEKAKKEEDRETARKAEAKARKLEAETKEKARCEAEANRQEALARKEQERLEKQKQAELKKQQEEQARLLAKQRKQEELAREKQLAAEARENARMEKIEARRKEHLKTKGIEEMPAESKPARTAREISDNAAELIKKGDKFYNNRDYDKAKECYGKARFLLEEKNKNSK